MRIIQKIRKEFDEPFRDTVQSFAKMGYSKRCTALTLGITTSYFHVYLQRYAPDVKWPLRSEMNDACKRTRGGGWPKGKQRPKNISDEDLLNILRQYPLTIGSDKYDYKRSQNQPWASTIIRRFGSWRKAKRLAHEKLG